MYHSYEDLETEFRGLETKFPDLAKLQSIGKSVENRELYVLQVNIINWSRAYIQILINEFGSTNLFV